MNEVLSHTELHLNKYLFRVDKTYNIIYFNGTISNLYFDFKQIFLKWVYHYYRPTTYFAGRDKKKHSRTLKTCLPILMICYVNSNKEFLQILKHDL